MLVKEAEELKQGARAVWAAGDYDAIAEKLWAVGRRILRHTGVRAGDEVLDVACGTGNAALAAAAAGGRVIGLDLTPELFERGRARAAEAGLEIEWVEGDAEALPLTDERFDVVLSTFGAMFAPRHAVAAQELARVLRPGGRLGLCNWTPDGFGGDFFQTMGRHLPPPPVLAPPPTLWGTEDHVTALFKGKGVELRFEREEVDMRFDSVEAAVQTYATTFGPVVKARELLEPQGRWAALRNELAAFFARHNQASDGRLTLSAAYLVVVGVKQP